MAATSDTHHNPSHAAPDGPPLPVRVSNRAPEPAELVVSTGIAVFLVVTALSLLVQSARQIGPLFGADDIGQGTRSPTRCGRSACSGYWYWFWGDGMPVAPQ